MKNKNVILGLILAFLMIAKRTKSKVLGLYISNVSNAIPTHPNKKYAIRSLNVIQKIIVHHSATSSGSPASYANYHISKGWPGIGYHFVIQKNGEVFQTNDLERISYHTTGQNANSIGICLTGNFDVEQPTPQQMNSLKALIINLESQLGNLYVHGHNEFSSKTCPGNNFDLQPLKMAV